MYSLVSLAFLRYGVWWLPVSHTDLYWWMEWQMDALSEWGAANWWRASPGKHSSLQCDIVILRTALRVWFSFSLGLTVKSAPFLSSAALKQSNVGCFSAKLMINSAESKNNKNQPVNNIPKKWPMARSFCSATSEMSIIYWYVYQWLVKWLGIRRGARNIRYAGLYLGQWRDAYIFCPTAFISVNKRFKCIKRYHVYVVPLPYMYSL